MHDLVKKQADKQMDAAKDSMGQLERIKAALDEETRNPSKDAPYCGNSCTRHSSVLDPYCPTGCYAAERPRCLGCRHFGAKTNGRDDGCPLSTASGDGSSKSGGAGAGSGGAGSGVGSDLAKKLAANAKPDVAKIETDSIADALSK